MQTLRNSQQFRRVYEQGNKIHTPFFSAFFLKNDLGERRYGITVTRKIGCAVVRNRCKRRLREIVRRHELGQSCYPSCSGSGFVSGSGSGSGSTGFDLVLNVKSELANADFDRLQESFARLMKKVSYEMDRSSSAEII
ncbi:MAG: ribonuclease P protein component [Chloracidobacterium sp.]|nr:ribonuclease P protein component [Chloracidobacterium sp.]